MRGNLNAVGAKVHIYDDYLPRANSTDSILLQLDKTASLFVDVLKNIQMV